MIELAQSLEKQLQNSEIGFLKPQLILIGSVIEGTRLFEACEIDIMVKFKYFGSKEALKIGKNATNLIIPGSNHEFNEFADQDGKFNYPHFLALRQ